MIDENLTRWIHASVNKHFTYMFAQADPTINISVENEDAAYSGKAWCEIRFNGPRTKPEARDEFQLIFEVSILCNAILNDDLYLIDRIVGIAQNAMTMFPIKRLGAGVGDDDSTVGCANLRIDVPRPIDTVQWGQLDTEKRVTQSVVEGYYQLEL